MIKWPFLLWVCVFFLSGCEKSNSRQELVVFAASSLRESFEALEVDFESTHPEVDVKLVFAGSQALRLQIENGARASVFASANVEQMGALREAGKVGEPTVFARNALVVIVPNDSTIQTFEDVKNVSRIVIGAENVPVGHYAREVMRRSGARYNVVSEESNVRLVRSKVELGEADAAFVYKTDVLGRSRVRAVEIPPELNVMADYPIAVVQPSYQLADHFLRFVLSTDGSRILEKHGFVAP